MFKHAKDIASMIYSDRKQHGTDQFDVSTCFSAWQEPVGQANNPVGKPESPDPNRTEGDPEEGQTSQHSAPHLPPGLFAAGMNYDKPLSQTNKALSFSSGHFSSVHDTTLSFILLLTTHLTDDQDCSFAVREMRTFIVFIQ
ncbi:hypothetical protein F2P81_025458 [Scophthalmus maximus]|uniref:Uncharacterized protein n=1 Tax=Scophthalmus maximus TaxID=52904 RepID=A0A6A4RTE8_SCOMX|nr:hypothetical protein F2P81_025458 [Scophthalmus maximus]